MILYTNLVTRKQGKLGTFVRPNLLLFSWLPSGCIHGDGANTMLLAIAVCAVSTS